MPFGVVPNIDHAFHTKVSVRDFVAGRFVDKMTSDVRKLGQIEELVAVEESAPFVLVVILVVLLVLACAAAAS